MTETILFIKKFAYRKRIRKKSRYGGSLFSISTGTCDFICYSSCTVRETSYSREKRASKSTKKMKNFKIVSIFICILSCFALQARAQNYCNLKSCSPGTHTLCKYPSSQPAAACVKYRSVGLTSAQQNAIVAKHNEYRRRVANGQETRGNPGPQPRATNMKNLSWDPLLAIIAQRWANQCNFGHDTCRNVDEYSVGQNVGSIGTTGPYDKNVEKIVTNWYNEVKDFDRNEVPKFTGRNFQNVGHYTQLVWANTEKIGCGLIEYLSGRFNTTYLVCNYGPTGNFIGQPVYKTR